jgi:phage head maturation protease
MADDDPTGTDLMASTERKAPVEIRSAAIDNIDFGERIVTAIAVPYEQRTVVPFRGELWEETVGSGAFDGIETSTHTYRVNRDHDKQRLVGKIVNYYPGRNEGLVVDAYISPTQLGDETLQLAKDGILGASVGMAVRPTDQVLQRNGQTRSRYIRRAFLDHLALVPDPAYVGAEIIGVRHSDVEEDETPAIHTPIMDRYVNDPILAWMFERAANLDERGGDAPGDGSKPYGNVRYADPGYQKDGVKRYPIDSAEHAKSALAYISQEQNASKYSAEDLAKVKAAIKAACKKFGIEISAD